LRDGIESWLPTLYSEAFGRESTESILVSVILPIFSIVSVTSITAIHKRPLFNNEIRGAGILFAASIVMCLPLAILISNEATLARIVCLVLAAIICAAMHGVNFLLISCLPGRFARFHRAATVSGICNSFVYVGAAASTYGIAYISDKLGWGVTVISWCAILAIGIIFALISRRRYAHFISSD
jgi:sugar phosphate permease